MATKTNSLDMFKNIKPVEKKTARKESGRINSPRKTEDKSEPEESEKSIKKIEDKEKNPVKVETQILETPENETRTTETNDLPVAAEISESDNNKPENKVPTERKLVVSHVNDGEPTKIVSVRMLDTEFARLKLYSLRNGIPKYEVVHSIIQSEKLYDASTGFPDDNFIVMHALDTVKNKVSRKQKCAFRLTIDDIDFVSEMSAKCAMTKQEYYIFLLNEYIK